MKLKAISVPKFEEDVTNEDAVGVSNDWISVSDGAGGGGLYADRWSTYLIKHLPNSPFDSFEALDNWIADIWEPFYNDYEEEAKKAGGMVLDKFYSEGSYATLVVIWLLNPQVCAWIGYGDSVAFHYNFETQILEHSFTTLKDFNRAPYLINCKDELRPEGFRSGTFRTTENSVVFVASDALAHYILMMYEVANKTIFKEELEQAIQTQSKNALFIEHALYGQIVDFEKDVLKVLLRAAHSTLTFNAHLKKLKRKGLLAHDDYSLGFVLQKQDGNKAKHL